VGAATWAAVADRLTAAGHDVTVPSLLAAADGPGPYWPQVVAAVADGLSGVPPGQAAEARRRGWAVRSVPGEHLHQVVDPDATAGLLLELAGPARPLS
jgi:hypothetical protein